MPNPLIEIEKVGLTYVFPLKFSGNRYYITIPKPIIEQFELMFGDQLKIKIIEAWKNREVHESVLEEILEDKLKELRAKKKNEQQRSPKPF